MKTISFINLKGGVAKTVTTANIGWLLAKEHKKRVLLIDMDAQGHLSRFWGVRSSEKPSVADLLTFSEGIRNVIQTPDFSRHENVTLDVVQANLSLITAAKEVLMDCTMPQQMRLSKALQGVAADYDFCLIDHAPSLDMATINGLVASDFVVVPVEPDDFALDGLDILTRQVSALRDGYAPGLTLAGCLICRYRPTVIANSAVCAVEQSGLPVFRSKIRTACAVPESVALKIPIDVYRKQSPAAYGYRSFCEELLQCVQNGHTDMREKCVQSGHAEG